MSRLEEVLRAWYIYHGYCVNENNWFRVEPILRYKNKLLVIFDETGKTKHNSYTFHSTDTDEVIKKAIDYFKVELTDNDKKNIAKEISLITD